MRTLKGLMLTFCFSIIMIVASVSVVHAAYIVYEDGKRVYDLADLFTSYEEDKLTAYALEVEEEAKTEVYILTTDDTDGKSSMEYADDFGDNGAFGYDYEYGTYIVMLINMDEREIWLSTSGKAEDYFSEYRIEWTLDAIFEHLPNDYYSASYAYMDAVRDFMTDGEPSVDDEYDFPEFDDNYDDTYYGDDDYYYDDDYDDYYRSDDMGIAEMIFPAFLISAVVSGIILAIMIGSNSTKMTAGSRTYMAKEGIKLHAREDVFTHTTTVKRRIDTDSSGGSRSGGSRHSGGGGHHRSSSGRSHGGGGRRF